ncbi:cold-shock protein [Rhodococcus pyridinivorans]|uniref:cold-shock protein n=1 Tax=Rhodococcus pyridinivorans TaxID=103816 RepID=UPI003AAF8CE8
MPFGTVRWYDPEKGRGEIAPDGSAGAVIPVRSAYLAGGLRRLSADDRVSFTYRYGPGPTMAQHVALIPEPTAEPVPAAPVSRGRVNDAIDNFGRKHENLLGAFVLAVMAGVVILLGWSVWDWARGDDTPSDNYAFDAVYVPSQIGSATPEARFVDDAVNLGLRHSSGVALRLVEIGDAICNDIQTGGLSDKEAAELLAEANGLSLSTSHYLVLSAQYNLC